MSGAQADHIVNSTGSGLAGSGVVGAGVVGAGVVGAGVVQPTRATAKITANKIRIDFLNACSSFTSKYS